MNPSKVNWLHRRISWADVRAAVILAAVALSGVLWMLALLCNESSRSQNADGQSIIAGPLGARVVGQRWRRHEEPHPPGKAAEARDSGEPVDDDRAWIDRHFTVPID